MTDRCPTCRQPLDREPETSAAAGERTDAEGVDVAYGSIMLRGVDRPPLVFGEEVARLKRGQYRDVRALVVACTRYARLEGAMPAVRLSDLIELFYASAEVSRTFRRLKKRSLAWNRAILTAGLPWGGYSIASRGPGF